MASLGKTRNPGLGRDFYFFGKFKSKILAARSEREHPGSFIVERKGYYYVLKEKPYKPRRRNPYILKSPDGYVYTGGGSFSKDSKEAKRFKKISQALRIRGFLEDRSATDPERLRIKRVRNPEWKPPFAKRKRKRLGVLYHKAFEKFSRENPRHRGVLIYGRVLKIFARKTSGPYKGQEFVHTFKPGAVMIGMPDGSLRISHD